MKDQQLTADIIACCMRVHSKLGRGYREIIYHRALKVELRNVGIEYQSEYELPIFYYDEFIGTSRPDFLIAGRVVVELKATPELEDRHYAQTFNYLEVGNFEIGLLINFGEKSLNFKRLTNKRYEPGKIIDRSMIGNYPEVE